MGQGIEFIIANNSAVALHVMEETKEIIDKLILPHWILFKFQKTVGEIFNEFV